MITRCTSRFYQTQCHGAHGHTCDHYTWDACGHITTWNEPASDQWADHVHDHVGGTE